MQLSPYGLLLLTQPLQSSEQHIRANLEFSCNFAKTAEIETTEIEECLHRYKKQLTTGLIHNYFAQVTQLTGNESSAKNRLRATTKASSSMYSHTGALYNAMHCTHTTANVVKLCPKSI